MFSTSDTYRFAFTTVNSSGALTNADSTPTGVLVVNGSNSGATVTISNAAGTGKYRGSVALSGLSAGDEFYVEYTATVGGVTQSQNTKTERIGSVAATTNTAGATLATWGTDVVATLKRLHVVNDTSDAAIRVENTGAGAAVKFLAIDDYALLAATTNTEAVWFESSTSAGFEIIGNPYGLFIGGQPAGGSIQLSNPIVAADGLFGSLTAAQVNARLATLPTSGTVSTLTAAQVNAEADTALADAGVTTTRMGYVDKLNVGGTLLHTGNVNVSNGKVESNVIEFDGVLVEIAGESGTVGVIRGSTLLSTGNVTVSGNRIAANVERWLGTEPLALSSQKVQALADGAGGGSAGTGDIAVTHNYGGTDALRILDAGSQPIDNATLTAYDATAYTTNPATAPIVARQFTGSDGRWIGPMMLDAGSYTLVIGKSGAFVDRAVSLVVA